MDKDTLCVKEAVEFFKESVDRENYRIIMGLPRANHLAETIWVPVKKSK